MLNCAIELVTLAEARPTECSEGCRSCKEKPRRSGVFHWLLLTTENTSRCHRDSAVTVT